MTDDTSYGIKPLNPDNFTDWKASMESLLKTKRLWKQVGDASVAATDIDNEAAHGWIMRYIEPQQRNHVAAGLNAHGAWTALCAAHQKQGPQAEVRYLFKLFTTRYVDGTKMEDHLSNMKEIFDRLHAIGSSQFSEQTRASMVLAMLPESWSNISSREATSSNVLTFTSVSHRTARRSRSAAPTERKCDRPSLPLHSSSARPPTRRPSSTGLRARSAPGVSTSTTPRTSAAVRPLANRDVFPITPRAVMPVPTSSARRPTSHSPPRRHFVSGDGWVIDSGCLGSLLRSPHHVHVPRTG